MRIAITGSWRPAKNKAEARRWKLRDERGFQQATRLLGAQLARLGHRLVVATDAPRTADCGAVEGAARIAARSKSLSLPVVDLLRADANAFEKLAIKRPGFLNLRSAPESPTVAKLYQVQRADVVLALGGADKTLEAIIAAAASGKRVVPVGCFGGAAEQAVKIFEAMAGSWGPHVPSSDVLGPLATTWSPGCVELILRGLGVRYPRILIVHGRDLDSRTQLANLLIRYGMPPSIMALEEARGRSLPEKFEEMAQTVDAAIALVTPDDIGRLRNGSRTGIRNRARQNVWVEFGWFWGALGRPRVLLLGKEGVEMPSDLSGLIVEQFKKSPVERAQAIVNWVEALGWPRPTLSRARTRKRSTSARPSRGQRRT
jgi:hypothetical protein